MRSRISSKLIFASFVGYFDRAYYGFYVISSTMLVLIENKIWQLWNSVSVQIRSMWLWICMRPYLYWLGVILLTAVWGEGTNMHYSVNIISYSYSNPAEHCITWAVGHSFNLYMSRRRFFWPFYHQVMSDDIDDIQDPRYHMSRRTFF